MPSYIFVLMAILHLCVHASIRLSVRASIRLSVRASVLSWEVTGSHSTFGA